MHNLAKYLPPPLMKGESHESDNWDVHNKGLSENEIHVAIKDGPPSSIQDELENNKEDYCPLAHEYWCDLLSTIKVKDNSKRAATQINMLATSRSASHSDSNKSVRVPCKNRARTGVIPSRKQHKKKAMKHNGIQCCCALCKKA